jgi:hypothetical protein
VGEAQVPPRHSGAAGQLGRPAGDHDRRGHPTRPARPTPRGSRTPPGPRRAPSSPPREQRTGPRATAPDRPSARRIRVRLGVNRRSRIDGVRSSERRNRSISTTSTPIPITRCDHRCIMPARGRRSRRSARSAASLTGSSASRDRRTRPRSPTPSRRGGRTGGRSPAAPSRIVLASSRSCERTCSRVMPTHVPAFTSGTKMTVRSVAAPRATSTSRSSATRRLVPDQRASVSTRLAGRARCPRGRSPRSGAVDRVPGEAGDLDHRRSRSASTLSVR